MQRNFIKQNEFSKLPGARWRTFLKVLAKPARRVHNYRTLTANMVETTIGSIDSKPCDE
jgi:hypothetical protein